MPWCLAINRAIDVCHAAGNLANGWMGILIKINKIFKLSCANHSATGIITLRKEYEPKIESNDSSQFGVRHQNQEYIQSTA